MRAIAFAAVAAFAVTAQAAPKKKPPTAAPEQKEADRHFKSGVALFKEGKFTEALAEFERANEIAPHPLVLYNIAACHRELSNYAEAVKFYRRFLSEAPARWPPRGSAPRRPSSTGSPRASRRSRSWSPTAPSSRRRQVARRDADRHAVDPVARRAPHLGEGGRPQGRRAEAARRVHDEVSIQLNLPAVEEPVAKPTPVEPVTAPGRVIPPPPASRRFALGAGFGTNLRSVADTGAPSLGIAVAIGSRPELGVDAVVIAYAVIPAVRVRVAGDALSLHVVGAVPIAINAGAMSETFAAGMSRLGLRHRCRHSRSAPSRSSACRQGARHDVPAFVGGELWF
jgi:hypothetical protein